MRTLSAYRQRVRLKLILTACIKALLHNFVAIQFARKIAQCNIPWNEHVSQLFWCRNRCEKKKSVLLFATILATLQRFFPALRTGVTLGNVACNLSLATESAQKWFLRYKSPWTKVAWFYVFRQSWVSLRNCGFQVSDLSLRVCASHLEGGYVKLNVGKLGWTQLAPGSLVLHTECRLAILDSLEITRKGNKRKQNLRTSPVGLEPTTFRLTAERANRLRQGDNLLYTTKSPL